MSSTTIAAGIAVSLFCTMSVIQLMVALSILPTSILWGGSQNELTPALRVANILACFILLGMAYIIRRRSQPQPFRCIRISSWVVVAYMTLNTVGNALSSNDIERYVFGSMTVIMALTSGIVAASTVGTVEEETALDPNHENFCYES